MLMSRTPLPTSALSKIQPFSNDCRVISGTANANVIFLSRGGTPQLPPIIFHYQSQIASRCCIAIAALALLVATIGAVPATVG